MKFLILIPILASIVFAGGYNKSGVASVTDKLYIKECGACHFAYQPGLLPANAWNKIMGNLDNHFNTDATLSKEDFNAVSKYLNDNSAEKFMNYKRSSRIVSSLKFDEIPEAISKTPYITRKHKNIRADLITQKEVTNISNCMACHKTADKGIYSERDIIIPNFGRWKD